MMASQHWTGKLDAYLDGELPADEERRVREHLRECPTCAADALERMQMKRSVAAAGLRFKPDAALRARVQQTIASRKPSRRHWGWLEIAIPLAAAIVLVTALWSVRYRDHLRERQLVSELIDQHVSTLASTNPVDVVSSDKHTVKPWFEGKVPFTFDLPDLQGTAFTLVGGRVSYIEQSPAAELIFRLRQHQLSVFITQRRTVGNCTALKPEPEMSFHVRSWQGGELCYFAVGDVGGNELDQLAALMKAPQS
jgi:anti-sigma factor RsiW